MNPNHEKIVSRRRIWPWVVFLIVGSLFFYLTVFVPQKNRAKELREMGCLVNIRQFAIAKENYRATNGHSMPMFTTDDQGKALHSWRVLLLPYLECGDLYNDINLDKPWDHSDNIRFHKLMPSIYRCPSDRSSEPPFTSYIAIFGENTYWAPDGKPRRQIEITDGSHQTLLFVESRDHQVNWMQPIDIDFESAIRFASERTLFTGHQMESPGSFAAFADGSARFVRADDNARALLTINGGESVTLR